MRPAGILVAVVALLVVGCGTVQPTGSAGVSAAPSPVALASPGPTPTPAPSPTPVATRSPSPVPSPVLAGTIAHIDGWTPLGRLAADHADTGVSGVLSGSMHPGWTFVMVSVACAGTGSVHVAAGALDRTVDCPLATDAPERMAEFVGDVPSVTATVTVDGSVAYEVLVDQAEAPLAIPPVLIAGAGKAARMTQGCGMYLQLAWGYDAVDDCATTLPGDPIPTIAARNGRVDIRIPGWTIVDGIVRCGRIGPNDIPEFIELHGCHPHANLDGSSATISGLPSDGGRRLLEFYLTAQDAAGDDFHVPYYAWVRP